MEAQASGRLNRSYWPMRRALAPTQEGSVDKAGITDDWIMAIEGLIDPVVSQSLDQAIGKSSEKQNLWIL